MDAVTIAPVLDFPPCTTLDQIDEVEHIFFGFFPGLRQFVRRILPVEHAEGVAAPDYSDALVTAKQHGTVQRVYGTNLCARPPGEAV